MVKLQIMVDSGLVVLIWLVQLIIYPSFRYTQEQHFTVWHSRYMRLISLIVGPLMLLQLSVELRYIFSGDYRWQRLVLLVAVLTCTFFISVPCHRRLQQGQQKDLEVINRLVVTNWWRTVFWSLLFIQTVSLTFEQLR
jgi:uncharacterized membrane protein YqjE